LQPVGVPALDGMSNIGQKLLSALGSVRDVDTVRKDESLEDREVVVDSNLVTSRQPADLPAFLRETMKQLGR